jgi:hypothetical protein
MFHTAFDVMPWTILLGTRGFSEMAWLGQEPFFWKLNLELFKVPGSGCLCQKLAWKGSKKCRFNDS